MARYDNCHVYVSKDRIKRHAVFNFGSMEKFIKRLPFSSARFYEICKTPHASRSASCIKIIALVLNVSCEEITYIRGENNGK